LGLDGRQAPLGESFHQQLQDPGQAVVMGLLSGEAVGYGTCALRTVSDGGLLGVVGELFVQERARRAGVGRAMMEALVSWSQAHGASGMDASALPGSRAVKSFFEAGGFTARLLVMHRPLN
jgi:GNAT superfamily N-acetyltransferase